MIKRTPEEVKAYADGFYDCYKNFTEYLEKGPDYAREKMKLMCAVVNMTAKIDEVEE